MRKRNFRNRNYGSADSSNRNRYRRINSDYPHDNDNRDYRRERDSDIYENEIVNESRDYGPSRSYERQFRNYNDDRKIFDRSRDRLRNTWNDWRNNRERDRDYIDYENTIRYNRGYSERDENQYENRDFNDYERNRPRREDVSSYRRNIDDDGYNRRDVNDRLNYALNDDYYRDNDRGSREFINDNRGLGIRRRRRVETW